MIESETERLLRESLHRRAEGAPDGAQLAERIVAAAGRADGGVVHRSFRWQTWVTPLVSAAAVAAVAVAITKTPSGHESASAGSAAGNSSAAGRAYAGGASASTRAPAAHTTAPIVARPPASSAAASSATSGGTLSGFQATDLTFVSDTQGWAIGTARCLDGSAGRCPAMLHTTDGRTWTPMPTPPIKRGHENLGIRFANDQVGYAFDPTVLFMTTDGGRTWQQQSGGALALETLDGNVVRLISPHTGCPGPCNVQVQITGIGSSVWSTIASASGRLDAGSVQLARAGQDVYVLVQKHTAPSTLISLADNGSGWRADGEPCPQTEPGAAAGYASIAVAAAPNRSVTVLCRTWDGRAPERVAVSMDAGAHFSSTRGALPAIGPDLLAGDPRGVLLAGGWDGVYRSTDGGASWAKVPGLAAVGFLGFESTDVARAVSADGRTVWTTTDGGAHWQPTRFP